MNYRQFSLWILASWLCHASMGLQFSKDLKHSDAENGALYSNNTEDVSFNETSSMATDEISVEIGEETTTSHSMLEETTKMLEVTAIRSKRAGLGPLAVGGLALLSGLLVLAFVVGLFMYCNRNTGFVYEPASSIDTSIDV